MTDSKQKKPNGLTRREALKLSGLTLGGMTVLASGLSEAIAHDAPPPPPPPPDSANSNSLFYSLEPYVPGSETLGPDEMRITFLGTSVIQRRTQACNSIFVELGNQECFVFDCGSGVTVNYTAMQIPMSKMRKVFLTHLHGDHTSDLIHLYCFGPQQDGKSPLYIWGPSASGIEDPKSPGTYYDDGTLNFCHHLRELNRWHSESQSFVPTQWTAAKDEGDGYDIIATELNWRTGETQTWKTTDPYPTPDPTPSECTFGTDGSAYPPGKGIAYEQNGVRISFFPAIHDRNGSISYKLEWLDKGLSMIFSGDTKPNNFMIHHATNGARSVDVLIHEMVVPPETWVSKNGSNSNPFGTPMSIARAIQDNSHTPEIAYGYLLNRMLESGKAPRLAVATHFQAEDDTNDPAIDNIRSWYSGPVTIASDFTVLNVTRTQILQRRAVVSDYAWYPPPQYPKADEGMEPPKYADENPSNPYAPMAPLAQFDHCLLANAVDPCNYDPLDYGCVNPYQT